MAEQKKYKILVLTDHLPWGHRSIAKAIYSYLNAHSEGNGLEVHYRQIKSEQGVMEEVYKFIYRYSPKTGELMFNFEKNSIVKMLYEDLCKKNLPALEEEITQLDPDLIISSYFLHSFTLSKWKKETDRKFKLWTVVADPWTTYSTSIVAGVDLHLVYDDVVTNLAVGQGIEKDKIKATGWWVRPEMYEQYDRKAIRQKLGFTDDRPVIFVGGGSMGTNTLVKILPALFVIKEKVGFIFNTGTDAKAFRTVESYRKALARKTNRKSNVQIKNLGWIDNMAEVLSACDIVFGKAGPNFLFDVIAAKKPFVSITHIGGQEDGNIDLIVKKGLGWVREKNGEILVFLKRYLERPDWYNHRFRKEIDAEASYNQKSLPQVLELINAYRSGGQE